MKKIIAAAAGLMIAGTAMVASAAVEFSGDARARYYYQDGYTLVSPNFTTLNSTTFVQTGPTVDDSEDHWRNRVRLKVKGTTKGGSYAIIRLRADNNSWGEQTGNSMVNTDLAYVGTDFGCVNVEAGRNDFGVTTGWWNDVNLDLIKATYNWEDTTVIGFYSIQANARGTVAQDENRLMGIVINQGFADWNATLGVSYQGLDVNGADPSAARPGNFYSVDGGVTYPSFPTPGIIPGAGTINPVSNNDAGVTAALNVAGQAGPVSVEGEIGYQEDGFFAGDNSGYGAGITDVTGDDGYGGFINLGMDWDAFGANLIAGFTLDGYVLGAPVGFVMIGGDKIVTPGAFGNLGQVTWGPWSNAMDTIFVGVATSYQATEDLGLGFNLAYATMEDPMSSRFGAVMPDIDAFEVSGRATYAVNDGTNLIVEAGYVALDESGGANVLQSEDMFGAAVSLELKF